MPNERQCNPGHSAWGGIYRGLYVFAKTGKNVGRAFLNLCAGLALIATQAKADPDPDGKWWLGYQTGVYAKGTAFNATNPATTELVNRYLIGLNFGYDKQIGQSPFEWGIEFQANYQFGAQDLYELVLPVSLRYHPSFTWSEPYVDSVGFGLGMSYYNKQSTLEMEKYGQTRKDYVYWYIEIEFAELKPGDNLYLRLHHRSNAFGALEPNGGSNAFVVGFRRSF